MKEVFLIVEFMSKRESVYAVEYTGIMTQRYIYAELTQVTGCPEDPRFIRVERKDTIDMTDKWESSLPRLFRHIRVPGELGLKDSRIDVRYYRFPDEIREAIKKHIEKNKAESSLK